MGANAAAAVMKLVQDQLAEERTNKSSLETRAIGVITSSGALATLIFGLAALVTKSTSYDLPGLAQLVLGLTLVAFVGSAVLAIVASRPRTYQEVTIESLRDVATKSAMSAPAVQGEPEIARVLVDIIDTARKENGHKARLLRSAVTLEAVAAILLAIAVAIVLLMG
ncbi:hypothetical protein ACX80Q_04415 [Arthrobacter sp. HLT1-20]